jgi:hypothetical protein
MKLFSRKLLFALSAPLMLASCATMAPPQPPSLELPKPPLDLRALRRGNNVTLTWTIPSVTTDRQSVRSLGSTRICRSLESRVTECGTPVGEAPPLPVATTKASTGKKPAATYTDTLASDLQQSNPSGFVTYAVEVLNRQGRGAGLSNQVRVPTVPTAPAVANFAAQITAHGVRISWTLPPPPEKAPGFRCLFRIYRRLEGSTTQDKLADLDLPRCQGITAPLLQGAPSTPPAAGEAAPEGFVDQTFEWEKTYLYHGTVVSVIGEPGIEVEGEDTPDAKVFAHDVFPPAVPSGLQAVFSGPGQAPFIDLIWAPVADIDLDGYNVYRCEGGAAPVKLNAELVKTPAYRDANVTSGKSYSYSVSAVDVRGNESARSEEAGERVP